jgi:type II secretory pathway component GspD/PulD (secretin)
MRYFRKHVTSLILASLAAGGVYAAEQEKPKKDDATPAPALTPDQEKFWEEAKRDLGVNKDSIAADAAYSEALALYRAARFIEAREKVEAALRAYPPHEKAQELREDILAVLSRRDNRLQMVTKWLHTIQDVKTQEIAVRMSSLLDSGNRNMELGNFAAAELDFDRVDVALRTFPYEFDWGDLPDVVATKKLEARASARSAELERRKSDRERAADEAERRSDLAEEVLRNNVDEMLRRARIAMDRKDYKRAEVDAWNAYDLDRRREDARDLYRAARKRGHKHFDDLYREDRIEKISRVHEEIHKALIPQSELLVYPEDWARRSLRRPPELGTSVEEDWLVDINNRLKQKLDFDFQDESFEEVVSFFRRVTGVNIITAPEVYAEGGGGTVTLTAKDMKFADALKWVLELTKLHMAVRDQAIYISNKPVTGAVALRIYDVADLISPVHDMPGRELAYTQNNSGSKSGGFDLFADAAPEGSRLSTEDLVDFIQKNVAQDNWGEENGTGITARTGSSLFINHTPEVHRLVELLLKNLREQQALQVMVAVRLLNVTKNFYEEIGFEWTDQPPVGWLDGSSTHGFDRLDQTEHYNGDIRVTQPLPTKSGAWAAASNPRENSNYARGLQIEGAYNRNSFLNQEQLNMVFAAVEEEQDATQVQHPQIVCFNGQRAHCSFMHQYAYIADYQIVSGNLDPTIQVLNFGDILDVRPVVSSDRKYVTIEIRPSSVSLKGVFTDRINAPTLLGGGTLGGAIFPASAYPIELPNVLVRTLRSTVRLPDKGNLLIGGYSEDLRQRTHQGVPFLSHIPFLGRLFSRNGIYDENLRLYYLLTTQIIDMAEQEGLQ